MSNVAERIKKLIEKLGIQKQEFAKKIDRSTGNISNWLMGKNPSKSSINKICKEFNVNPGWLQHGQGEMFLPLHDGAIKYNGQHTYGDALAQAQAEDEKPATPGQVSDLVQKAIDKAIERGQIKIAIPTDPGIKRPLIRLAQCGTPAKIAYDTGELTTISSRYEYIDVVVQTEGDSMKEEGIWPGSMVYIKKQNYCEAGQIVLISNHDFPDESRLVLKKAKRNGRGEIIFVNGLGEVLPLGDKIEIIGVAKHVMRDI